MSVYPDHVIVPIEDDQRRVPLVEAAKDYWIERATKAEIASANMVHEREDQARGALVGMAACAVSGALVGFLLGWLL